MTTEKFFCKECTCVCYLSISFTPGDEKTKSALVCPLQFNHYNFQIVDKSPERAEIKTGSTKTRIQLEHLHRLLKDCSKCLHNSDSDFCFKKCRAFSEYEENELLDQNAMSIPPKMTEQTLKEKSIY